MMTPIERGRIRLCPFCGRLLPPDDDATIIATDAYGSWPNRFYLHTAHDGRCEASRGVPQARREFQSPDRPTIIPDGFDMDRRESRFAFGRHETHGGASVLLWTRYYEGNRMSMMTIRIRIVLDLDAQAARALVAMNQPMDPLPF